MPTSTRLPSSGCAARADTEPLPAVVSDAWTHEVAWLVVRQIWKPPVHRCCRMPWFIVNGAMNRKLLELSEMPVMASVNVAPPFSER